MGKTQTLQERTKPGLRFCQELKQTQTQK